MVWRRGCYPAEASDHRFRNLCPRTKEIVLLTEATVEKMFRSLMNDPARNEEIFDKAEELLEEELRPESPLRHRLTVELEELREIATPEN